jgi:hypothetical protein
MARPVSNPNRTDSASGASTVDARAGRSRRTKLLAWQGFTLQVPPGWDLTGFSGDSATGYLRADDSEELGIEIKWETESKRRKAPDVSVRREGYLNTLARTARKKRIEFESKDLDALRTVQRPERDAVGFQWVGDRKAIGAVWHCRLSRRIVIVQVLGHSSGRGGLSTIAEDVLGSLECRDAEPGQRVWAIYDLITTVPSDFALVQSQLMNVTLRLSFARGAHRLSVEQWSAASVARGSAYLDDWLRANSRAELREARFRVEEAAVNDLPAIRLVGGPALGKPMAKVVSDALQLQRPATRFQALAWEDARANAVFAVQEMRPRRAISLVDAVASQTRAAEDPS